MPGPPDYAVARRRMVEEQLRGRGIQDPRVLRIMAAVADCGVPLIGVALFAATFHFASACSVLR